MNRQTGSAHIIIVIVLVVALIGTLGFIFWQNVINKSAQIAKDTNTTNSITNTVNGNTAPVETSTPATGNTAQQTQPATGTISGYAVYPSDGYPSEFKVCALNPSTKTEISCTSSLIAVAGSVKKTYQLSVAAGDYLVIAKTSVMSGYYDGYMQNNNYDRSGFDLCDARYHTPITVSVAAGASVTGIDAGNFWYTPENC